MNKARYILATAFLLLFLTSPLNLKQGIAKADSETASEAAALLIAAIPRSFPPQYAIDEQGKPYGFAIDVMNAVAEKAGYRVIYRVYDNWLDTHQAVKDGEADLIPNMGITPERSEFVDFTSPVETFAVSLFVRSDSSAINSIQELSGRLTGVIEGNVATKILHNRQLKLRHFPNLTEALLQLLSGHIDAIAYPDPVVWRQAQEIGLGDKIRKLSPSLIEIKRAIGVGKHKKELLKTLNDAVAVVIRSEIYKNIYSRWYAAPIPFWSTGRNLLLITVLITLLAIGLLVWRYYSLKQLNQNLILETTMRRKAERLLKQFNAELEQTIHLKTKELAEAQRIGQMGSWILDLQTNQLSWSDQIYRIFEIDPQQFVATYEHFLETIHPDDRGKVDSAYQASLRDRQPYKITHRLLFPDGRIKWVAEQCETTFDQDGKPVISRGTVLDITERRATERQLTLIQYAVDHISEAAHMIAADGHFQYVNQATCRSLGFSRDKLLRMHLAEIDQDITEESFPAIFNRFKQAGSSRFEATHRHQDGHNFPVEIVVNHLRFEDEEFLFAVARDISDIKAAQKEIQRQHSLLQQVINGVSDPIMMINSEHSIRLMNEAARATASATDLNLDSPKCYAVSHHFDQPCHGSSYPCPLQQVLETGKTVKVVHDHPDAEGTIRTMELLANPIFDKEGNVTGIIESGRDITDYLHVVEQLKKNEHRLDHIAHHDFLTGTPNRLLFVDRLQHAIVKAKRNRSMVALLFIDLDRFKQINDSFGHPAGDHVLKEVAIRLQSTIREEDTIARIGGDEFTIILDELEHTNSIRTVAQKLLGTFKQGFKIQQKELFLSGSIGISIYPQDGNDANTLIRNADSAMYRAKEQGRNSYSFYTSEMTALAFERLMMENSLRTALDRRQLILHYQPQIDIGSRKIVGIEALVRWQHPDLGLIPPAQFIPLAEESGLIQPIGEWILRKACQQAHHWHTQGLNPGRISVNCNLSGRQLNNDLFLQGILNILEETEIDAGLLELEITETTIMNDPNHLSGILSQLCEIGVTLAIDDFGTGYSSLSYLKTLPISKLKIDKSFIRDIPHDADDMAITRAIVALGKSLQMQVIAEGVETEAQASFLKEEGCFLAQGFLYARPMDAEALGEFLNSFQ